MDTAVVPSEWYAAARARAVAAGRRRRATEASTAWPDFTPPVALADGPLGAVQAADREIARQTALRARAVAEFAALRPADHDRAQGEPGAMSPQRWAARPELLRGVSEWAGRELAIACSLTAEAAEALLLRSVTLVTRLPGTLAALEAGALHPGHLWTMLEKVAPIVDDQVRAEVEAGLLRWAAGRVVTPPQLNDKARREVARRDARAAARRLQEAIKKRGVHVRPDAVDGMATVTVVATMPEAQALYRALAACADALDDDGDGRTRGQKMVDCLLDLVLRPGETDLPPVQVLLTVVASMATLAGGDGPGEVDGHVVPAEMVRQLLAALTHPREQASSGDADRSRQQPVDPMPWQAREQMELEWWLAETERRLLSGELVDPDPDGNGDLVTDLDRDVHIDVDFDVDSDVDGDLACDVDSDVDGDLACDLDSGLDGELVSDSDEPDGDPETGDRTDGPDDELGGHPVTDDRTDGAEPPDDPPGQRGVDRDTGQHPREMAQAAPATRAAPPGAAPAVPGAGWWRSADEAVDAAETAVLRAQQELARARRLVHTAAAADAGDEAAWRGGPGGRLTDADDALALLRSATDEQRERLAELLAATGGGGLAERPRIAVTDALSGTLVALTDLPGLRRAGSCGRPACRRGAGGCTHDLSDRPGLGAPPPSSGYSPSAALDRHVRARDRRCRFPGCRRRVPRGGELDHHRPYPHGPTSADNLVGYCTTDHRGKHQAPGWQHELAPDGTLTVTTPSGLVAVTAPPPY